MASRAPYVPGAGCPRDLTALCHVAFDAWCVGRLRGLTACCPAPPGCERARGLASSAWSAVAYCVKFEGDRKPFDQLRGLLVSFTPNFEILPGTAPKASVEGLPPFVLPDMTDGD